MLFGKEIDSIISVCYIDSRGAVKMLLSLLLLSLLLLLLVEFIHMVIIVKFLLGLCFT